jgi:hypothetical protein
VGAAGNACANMTVSFCTWWWVDLDALRDYGIDPDSVL